jgi:outer membrane lipoprotein-sorting protein
MKHAEVLEPGFAEAARRGTLRCKIVLGLALCVASPAHGASSFDARELVRRAEDALQGETAEVRASMTITTPRWTRVVRFHSWGDRPGDRSFIRILEPRKDRGTGFLRLERSFWTYLPRVERTMRVPPSMMLQPWMGSDFTNDDLVRESSMADDYEAEAIGEREIDGIVALGVKLTPHEDAPVVWARLELWVEKERFAPLLFLYYDEPEPGEFELLRRMAFSDIRDVAGRSVPHAWEVIPVDKPGHTTRMEIEKIELDMPLPDSIFTQSNLRRAEGAR